MPEAAEIIGIDFGTTTSFVATPEAGIVPLGMRPYLPSIAGVLDQRLLVGEAAEVLPPDRLIRSAKRAITDRREQLAVGNGGFSGETYPRDGVITAIIKEIASRARRSGSPLRSARTLRLGCPAEWSDDQRKLMLTLAAAGGVPVERTELVQEPVAAALGWLEREADREREVAGRLLVFDMGGGTLDVAVLDVATAKDVTVLASAGTTVAGDALDEAIYQDIIAHYGLDPASMAEPARAARHLLNAAVETKTRLSTDDSHDIFFNGRILGTQLRPLRYPRERLNDLFGPMLDKAVSEVERALRLSGTGDGVDFVLQVGGMSRVPLVQQRLEAQFPGAEHINTYGTADEAVVRGLISAGVGSVRHAATDTQVL